MGTPVLILGDSGAGKSYSLRNFTPEEVILLQCIPKMLPFRATGWKLNGKELPDGSVQRGNIIRFDAWDAVLDSINRMVLSKNRRVLVIDDFQVVMQHENMMRAYQTGYQKFTEMADHVWQIIMAATRLPDDFRVYFLAHTEESDGKIRMKTTGKMLNEKLTPEGYFSIVLRAIKKDGKHVFLIKGDDNDTAKAPPDLFPGLTEMDNDLKAVDVAITEFMTEL
ncbi:AAA family ATPase [Raoultella ornithinolytica]|uniref:AAA family ATPase n=1 Tax=Klebsiella/Raoultella group TaxID=2890311 RepID=UPI00072180DE|nr:AAA family ATPase [Raoultella ornithinolytica]HDS6467922.1 AAA family ATPase [Klebsiella michiganensis]ALQ48105.1 Phage DNA binding ATPase [Raoultella ornithinolytica]ELK6036093.1 AAA family ATPase [Raoultella ornithinolytica]ELM7288011.1 AAA family ATPase [Raoultella ornithinolytica]ELO0974542.1 AAA family ATPase [Raoultella ornithinolytica]